MTLASTKGLETPAPTNWGLIDPPISQPPGPPPMLLIPGVGSYQRTLPTVRFSDHAKPKVPSPDQHGYRTAHQYGPPPR